MITGRCLCGDIQYECPGERFEVTHCHCESCRRHASSAIATFITVPTADLRFTTGTPVAYASSPGVTRTHCGRCGSPISYESRSLPGETDLYVGTLSDPAAVAPLCHLHVAEQLPWFETVDALPRYDKGRRDTTPVRYGPRAPADSP
jgi:hypothetical protein